MSIKFVMSSNHLILCRPLLLPSVFPSIRIFSNQSVLRIRWPKYWSFSFSISPSNEHPGLISFRIDWFDFLEKPMFLSRGDRDLGVAFQTHPGRQAFISSGSKEVRSALESRRESLGQDRGSPLPTTRSSAVNIVAWTGHRQQLWK